MKVYFITETKHKVIQKQTCPLKDLRIQENCRAKLWLNPKTVDKDLVTFAQQEKYKIFH